MIVYHYMFDIYRYVSLIFSISYQSFVSFCHNFCYSFLLQMSKLIVLVKDHYIGRVTWSDNLALAHIKVKFQELQLFEKARGCPFSQFFEASPVKLLGVLSHELLLRKIKAGSGNENHVAIGGGKLKFSIGEFTLITGLKSGPYPEENVPKNTRLVYKYLNNNSIVRSQELESAFAGCKDKEDVGSLAWYILLMECYIHTMTMPR